jgi:hypothetical protein
MLSRTHDMFSLEIMSLPIIFNLFFIILFKFKILDKKFSKKEDKEIRLQIEQQMKF